MTKSDLKTGMRVKYKNGDVATVMLDVITSIQGDDDILVENGTWMPLSDYNDDLSNIYDDEDDEYDIVEVYKPKYFADITNDNLDEMELIWSRTKSNNDTYKEVTVKDVEEKFGCKVKIVG